MKSIQTSSTASQTPSEPPSETVSEPDEPYETVSGPVELSLDVVFDILSNERRRRAIRYLLAEPETATLGDLAEHIASLENDKPERALTSTERKRVYICLYQSHLPRMDDAGVIDFEEDRKTIEVGETMDQVTRFLPETEDAGVTGSAGGSSTPATDFVRAIGGLFRNIA